MPPKTTERSEDIDPSKVREDAASKAAREARERGETVHPGLNREGGVVGNDKDGDGQVG